MSVNLNGDLSQWTLGTTFAACASGQMLADGWRLHKSSTAVVTARRSTDVPAWSRCGRIIPYSLEIEVTTAKASPGAAEYAAVTYRGEGSEFADLIGRQIPVEFWLKGPAGSYNMHFSNGPETLSFCEPLTLVTSDIWQPFRWIVEIPPGVIGTDWWTDNRVGYTIGFTLATGSNVQDEIGVWKSGAKFGTAQSNLLATVGNKLKIAGLRVGGQVGGYQLPELVEQACMRYLEKSFDRGTAPVSALGFGTGEILFPAQTGASAYQQSPPVRYLVPKRKAVTPAGYNPGGSGVQARAVTHGDCTGTAFDEVTCNGFRFTCTSNGTTAINEGIGLHWVADASLPALGVNVGG